jgi:glycerophosphoryl diester phosphodiesterase
MLLGMDDEHVNEHGEDVPGPPWILGHRGAPREAPENTLASLRRALELGLDGVEYDVHAAQGGEPVLLHDETLDRTTDLTGPVADRPLSELVHADAGGWFAQRFVGEPVPLLEEALDLDGGGTRPVHHMIELKDPRLVASVAAALARLARRVPFRIASFHRSVCLEARDAGLPAMLLAEEANEDDRRFVRDERLAAYGTAPFGWHGSAGGAEWRCERWSWSVDEPRDLLEACRAPLFAFNTNEPRRALAVRALTRLAPGDRGPYPLQVPELEVTAPSPEAGEGHGEWSGRWNVPLRVRNPFPFPVRAALAFLARGGAFQVSGLPATLALDPGAEQTVELEVAGGSWSPLEDPTVALRFAWRRGRAARALVLDAPLARVRRLLLGSGAARVRMLREAPGEREASMAVRLRGRELLAVVEDAGGLSEVVATVRVAARVRRGRRGVRIRLPEELEPEGAPFSVGFEGTDPETGTRRLRRFAGGLPYGLGSGAPARLVLAGRA